MPNCHGCYWADRDPKSLKQVMVEEPDFLAPMKAGGEVPNIRVVKSCGAQAHYYKTYGQRDHDCKKFEDNAEAEAREAAEAEEKRKTWKHPTSRAGLPKTQNLLELIEIMAEKHNPAFDILFEAMMFPDKAIQLIEDLNDMNIRGKQIPLALAAADGNLEVLMDNAKRRDKYTVTYVNDHFDNVSNEEAVKEGAAKYGHGKPRKPRKEPAPRVMSISKLKKVRQKPKFEVRAKPRVRG